MTTEHSMMATMSLDLVNQWRDTSLEERYNQWRDYCFRKVLHRWAVHTYRVRVNCNFAVPHLPSYDDNSSEGSGPPPLASSDDDEPIPLPDVLPESESDSDSDSHTAGDYLRSIVLLQHSFVQRGQQAARGMRKRRSKR